MGSLTAKEKELLTKLFLEIVQATRNTNHAIRCVNPDISREVEASLTTSENFLRRIETSIITFKQEK